jgi:hypothetical protein
MTRDTLPFTVKTTAAWRRWSRLLVRWLVPVAAIAAATLGAPATALGQFDRPLASAIWFAELSGSDGTDGAGLCAALVSEHGHVAAFECTVTSGQPIEAFDFTVDVGLQTLVEIATSAVSGPGPYAFTLSQPPAGLIDGFDRRAVRVEGRTASGPAVQGRFTGRSVDRTVLLLDGGQVVPPSATAATGTCVVLYGATHVGLDCAHTVVGAQAARLHTGARGESGPALLEFALPPNTPNPVVLRSTSEDIVTALWSRDVYGEIGGIGGAVIRGQADGCTQTDGMLCLHDRFEVTADADLWPPEFGPAEEVDRISDALGFFTFNTFTTIDEETFLLWHFHGVSVRLRDRCADNGHYVAYIRQLTNGPQGLDVTIWDSLTGREATYGLREGEEVVEDLSTFACE